MLKCKESDVPLKKMAIDSAENIKNCKYTWGSLNIEKFIKKLNEEGIRDVKLEQNANGSIIHLVKYFVILKLILFSYHYNSCYFIYEFRCSFFLFKVVSFFIILK